METIKDPLQLLRIQAFENAWPGFAFPNASNRTRTMISTPRVRLRGWRAGDTCDEHGEFFSCFRTTTSTKRLTLTQWLQTIIFDSMHWSKRETTEASKQTQGCVDLKICHFKLCRWRRFLKLATADCRHHVSNT